MHTLSLHVRSGLCNRLRPILSAIAYCELTNRRLQIHWPRVDPAEKGGGGVFDAGLSELFEHPFEEVDEQTHQMTGRKIRQTEITLETKGDLNLRTINMFPGIEPNAGFPGKSCGSHAFLSYRHHYQKSFADYWSVMKPSAEVQRWIANGRELIAGRPCVAAIIRYALRNPKGIDVSTPLKLIEAMASGEVTTDHNVETDTKSDVFSYVERMKAYAPETVFFLATDCQYIEDILRAEFGDRIVNLPQTYRYDRETIQKRTAEMYIAAKCREILGAYISSYSEFAGWLAGGKYSACYLWPAGEGEIYHDMGSFDFDKQESTQEYRELEKLAMTEKGGLV